MRIINCILLTCLYLQGLYANEIKNFPGNPPFLPKKANLKTNEDNGIYIGIHPYIDPNDPETLTLKSAIYLALHRNVKVKQAYNTRKINDFSLIDAKRTFYPKFSIGGTTNYSRSSTSSGVSTTRSLNIGPRVNWKLPLGTNLSMQFGYGPTFFDNDTSSRTTSTNWSVNLTQPLLRGFGPKVNLIVIKDAVDTQKGNDLTLKTTLMDTITKVVSDYYDILEKEENLNIAQKTLVKNRKELMNRSELYKIGRKPKSDVTQAQLDITNAKEDLEKKQQDLETARTKLLNELGLPSDTRFKIVSDVETNKYISDLDKDIKTAMKKNISMQQTKLAYAKQQRALYKANDEQRWQLNLTLSHSEGITSVVNAASADTFSRRNNTTVGLDFTVPLDKVGIDKAKLTAAVNAENEEIKLKDQKRNLKTNVTAAYRNLAAAWRQYESSKQRQVVAERSYEAAQIQFSYGKMTSFTLSQKSQDRVSSEFNLVKTKVSYLKQILEYDKLLGVLLDKWDVKIEERDYTKI